MNHIRAAKIRILELVLLKRTFPVYSSVSLPRVCSLPPNMGKTEMQKQRKLLSSQFGCGFRETVFFKPRGESINGQT